MSSSPRNSWEQARLALIALLVVALPFFAPHRDGVFAQSGNFTPANISVPAGYASNFMGRVPTPSSNASLNLLNLSLAIPSPDLEATWGADLYAIPTVNGPVSIQGAVYRLSGNGTPTLVAQDSQMLASAEFPPAGSPFHNLLYVGRVFAGLGVLDVTNLPPGNVPTVASSPSFGEAIFGVAFAPSANGSIPYVTVDNNVYTVDPAVRGGGDDSWTQVAGGAFLGDLAFDEQNVLGGQFGGSLYAVEADAVRVIPRTDQPGIPFGDAVSTFVTLPATLTSLEFSRGGGFGNALYVGTNDGQIWRITSTPGGPQAVVFASGFDDIPLDGMEFSYDGKTMYVADRTGAVYRIIAEDGDGDGVLDDSDNCPADPNPNQFNSDDDAEGDACDQDDDNDGVADVGDNCPLTANADQADADGDGIGNTCDADDDNDGVADGGDNCPLTANPGQADADGDGVGNDCDADDDNDGVLDGVDACAVQSGSPLNNGCPLNVAALIQVVSGLPAPKPGTYQSLLSLLSNANGAIAKGLPSGPVLLRNFIKEVEKLLSQGKIGPAAAAALIAGAQQILIGL